MSSFVLPAPDLARRRGLQRMRAVALGLLLVAALVYVVTLESDGFLGFVNAGAEASMVGALADWFAVTALFRHPLGLPIPHTALIPERKAELGRSLRDFVVDNFLSEQVVRDKLDSAQPARRLGEWLSDDGHRRRVVREGLRVLRHALERVREDDVRTVVDQVVLPRLVQDEISPITGYSLASIVQDGAHHGLVDLALVQMHDWARDNEETVGRVVGARAPKWSPVWLDEIVIDRVHASLVRWLAEVRDDRDHPARQAFDDLLRQLADDLQHDPDTRRRTEELKVKVFQHPAVGRTVLSIWDGVRSAFIDATRDEDGPLHARIEAAVADLAARLVGDPELQERVDAYVADAAGYLVNTYGAEMASLISDTVDRWDGREAAERIELHVGRDLQFIRINGTVVGGIAGVAIHALTLLN